MTLQCIGHIINWIVKAFSFDNGLEIFERDVIIVKTVSNLEEALKLWKNQETIGKLPNLI